MPTPARNDARPNTSEAVSVEASRRALPSFADRARDDRPQALRHIKPLIVLAAAALICASLARAREVLIPVAVAGLLALVLTPLVDMVQRRGVHRVAAVLLAVVLVFSVLGGVVWMLALQVTKMSPEALTSEVVSRVEETRPAGICVVALPPGGLAPTRYLLKRLRARFPEVGIVVGRWDGSDIQEDARPLLAAGADRMGPTLATTREHVPELLPVTYCQTHHRGAHSYFVLRLLGYPRVVGYDRSWAEWGNRDELPVSR